MGMGMRSSVKGIEYDADDSMGVSPRNCDHCPGAVVVFVVLLIPIISLHIISLWTLLWRVCMRDLGV